MREDLRLTVVGAVGITGLIPHYIWVPNGVYGYFQA
jgi:hypothetical protein